MHRQLAYTGVQTQMQILSYELGLTEKSEVQIEDVQTCLNETAF